MSTLLLSVILLLSTIGAMSKETYGQPAVGTSQPFWTTTYGGSRNDEGWGVATDSEGNVYFAGFDRISGATSNVFLKKLRPDGTLIWSTSWGGQYDDEAFVVIAQGGYVYVGGRTFTSFQLSSADMMLLKFQAADGALVWSRTWDGGHGYEEVDGLAVVGNSLYVSGWTTGATSQLDLEIQKYDVNGTLVWAHSWGTSGIDEANGQLGVDDSYIYVVGHYDAGPLGSGGDALLVAFNRADGSYAWQGTWGGSGLDDAFGMTMDSNYIYSVGITTSFGPNQIFLLKYDKTGQLIWSSVWGGSGSELTRSVGLDNDSSFIYVAGSTTSYGNGDFDVVLLKYDQNGNQLWAKTWGGAKLDRSHAIAVNDPFIYIAGDTFSTGAGGEDAFLLKVDTEGGNTIPEFGPLMLPILVVTMTVCLASLQRLRRVAEP